ncbi:MAG: hypothetical protein DYG89_03260 [Caldilinea sp. CFX5]|nr:hypothetical protein [Caldilinea sp. CFX5]
MPDSVTTKTTTLVIEKPDSFEKLAEKYCLMRYELPLTYRLQYENDYSRLHIAMKTYLRAPYRLYTYDLLAPDKSPRRAIYAMFLRGKERVEPGVMVDSSTVLSGNEIQANQLPFHMVVKLLQMSYAQTDRTAFTAIGKYYVHAKGEKKTVTCLEIEIKGDRQNQEDEHEQVFQVMSHATRLRTRRKEDIKHHYKYIYPYFRRQLKGRQHLYIQLLPDEIDNYDGEIFDIYKDPSERATLDFHSNFDPERTRGKLLYDFIQNFTGYLESLGIHVDRAERQFEQFKPSVPNATLPMDGIFSVYLYDNRLDTKATSIEYYQKLLCSKCPGFQFEFIQDLHKDLAYPVLILQDHTKADFDEGGKFYGLSEDPYKEIRRDLTLIHVPKQSILVERITEANESDCEHAIPHSIAVCLNELYLKQFILRAQPLSTSVPTLFQNKQRQNVTLSQYAFVRQANYGDKERYGVFAWVENDRLCFADIHDPQGRTVLNELLAKQGVSWHEDVVPLFREKYFKRKQEEAELNFDFVIGPGFVAEIEDINERVLYEYNEIMARKHSLNQPKDLEDFALAAHYDQLKKTQWPTLDQLRNPVVTKATQTWTQATKFLNQLQQFDAYLGEISSYFIASSFTELTSSTDRQERIAEIFGKATPELGRRALKALYQKLGMFLSTKSTVDVLALYKGIWYDHSNRYMIGATDGLKDKQPRAHLIRQFDVYYGQENFDILPLLDMMAVKFVRHQQFTVYPFPFHLIDLYVENKLRYLE